MTVLYRLSVVGLVVSLVVGGSMLPELVPIGFGATGEPAAWHSKAGVILSVSVVSAILVVLFEVLLRVLPSRGGERLGLPYREHWMQPENRARFRTMIATDVAFFGLSTMVLLSTAMLVASRAARAEVEGLGRAGVAAVLVFALATLSRLAWMFTTRYRPLGSR